MSTSFVIPGRFNGPDGSGNGGYSAGALAATVEAGGSATRVTLRLPPPLDTPLTVQDLVARDAGRDVLAAELVDDDLTAVDPVDPATAASAAAAFAGLAGHPFPRCFVCGTDRAEGDGLRIFPGPVGADLVAAPWTPHPSLAEGETVGTAVSWAALDCPGAWAVPDLTGRPIVLGRMACVVESAPRVGEPHVVVGRHLGTEGRKSQTAATLYDSDGRIVARARHTWISVDPATFGKA